MATELAGNKNVAADRGQMAGDVWRRPCSTRSCRAVAGRAGRGPLFAGFGFTRVEFDGPVVVVQDAGVTTPADQRYAGRRQRSGRTSRRHTRDS
jgi:hypothetical protein